MTIARLYTYKTQLTTDFFENYTIASSTHFLITARFLER